MRLTGSRAYTRPQPVPKMPTGLIELMEDLTRDVLKNNPPDVYEFCAGHMRQLLDIRDGPSNKRPLTLEEKITRAQEKVKKRSDARWQKYVNEKRIDYISKVQSDSENIIYLEDTTTKPPVHPDLNIEKASEIEISHEPGYVNDFPVKSDIKLSTNNTEIEYNKKELSRDTEKARVLDKPTFTDIDTVVVDTSLNPAPFDIVTENVPNDNSVSQNEHFNVSAEIKTNIESLQNSIQVENDVDETTVDVIKEDLSNAPNITNMKNEVIEKNDSKIFSTLETAPTDKEMVKKSEQETGFQSNNSLADMGKVVNTAIGILNIINENPCSPIHKVETHDDSKDNSNLEQQKQDGEIIQIDVNEVKENNDSQILVNEETAPIDRIVKSSEQETGYQANNSLADMGKVVNTTIGILNLINESPCSPILKVETLDDTKYDSNHEVQNQESETFQTDVDEAKEKSDSNISSTQKTTSTDHIVKTSEHESEHQANNSLSDMSKVVNTAIGIINIINESPRSPTQNIETIEGININVLQTQQKDDSQTGADHTDLSTEIDNVITHANDKIKLVKKLAECYLDDPMSELNKSVDNDPRKQDMSFPSEKDLKNDVNIIIDESDNVNLADDTKMSDCGNYDNEPTIAPIITIADDSLTDSVGRDHELYNQHITNDDGSLVPNSVEVSRSVEPLINAVIINETDNVQEELTEGKIEIRISQVAETLNNEMPQTIENINMLEESDTSLNSSQDREINEVDIMHIEENGTHTHLIPKDIDCQSNMISVNSDDVDNVNITGVIKSISIDESTDGMDNTSLIESGTSDTTDDMFLNNSNNSNMDLETAAVTIQKVFRSFMFKSRASTFDDNDEIISLYEEKDKKNAPQFQTSILDINKDRRGISRMDTVLQTVNEEKSLSLSTDDSSTLSSAATTIQAHVRGFLVRNKLHSNKTASTNSLVNSDGHEDGDMDHKNNKTILNIHIVPEGGNYLSRDESMLTSMDLSLDGSPPSSLNLHPLGYDKNERRKQLKREDAIQSISPPSNNSGKLSEDVDSVKDMVDLESKNKSNQKKDKDDVAKNFIINNRPGSLDTSPTNSITIDTVIEAHKLVDQESSDADTEAPVKNAKGTLTKQSSDEMDVVTPFENKNLLADSSNTSMLMHSGEFHDIVLPTKVSRGDASVVREFKNVLVYFLLWNNS